MGYPQRIYRLLNLDNGKELVLDGTDTKYIPRNWDTSDYTIKRSTKNYSTEKKASDSLEFTGSGATFLKDAYEARDIEAKVLFQEYRYNPKTSVPEVYDIALFDFSEYKDEITVVKLQFNSGNLSALIKSKQNNKFELERTTDILGNDIGVLKKDEFSVINRPIYLDSKSKTNIENTNTNFIEIESNLGQALSYSFPLTVIYESDNNFVNSIPDQLNPNAENGLNAGLFYNINDVDKKLDINFITSYVFDIVSASNFAVVALSLIKYDGGSALNVKERIILKSSFNVSGTNIYERINVSYSDSDFELLVGESLAIQWDFQGDDLSDIIKCYFRDITSSLQVTEYSIKTDLPRRTYFLKNNDVGKRIMKIVTGDEDTYYSDYFKNSEFKNTGVTTGKLLRNFLDSKITTSLKNFLDNSRCQFNMGYNIEIVNGKETLVHEPLKHFFRQETVIKINEQVKITSRSVAPEFIFNTIKSGYKKPSGDNLYEEVNGLNEYNTTNEYITPITKVIEEYDIESPYRADSEGKELSVRKSIKIDPTADYRTDNDIFALDLKDIGTGVYEERTYKDDYEEEPKNIFNPDTSTGLRFTPFRNMQRHFWFLNGAYTKERDKAIRYTSTRGNSELITKKTGEEEKKENGNYLINTFDNPIFVSQWIEFEYPLNFDLLKLINGKTNVNGRKIPNTYFQIEFINEKNQKERGYLFELKPNGVGKWKLLKAL